MKSTMRLLVLILVIIFTMSACSKKVKTESDLHKMGIKGKITTLKEIEYDARDNFGNVEKSESGSETYWTFNEAGNIMENYEVLAGYIIGKRVCSYDGDKIQSIREAFDVNRYTEYIHTYQYGKKGELTTLISAEPDGGIVSKYSYTWDKQGNLLEEVQYDETGAMYMKEIYSYDDSGRKAEFIKKDRVGNTVRKIAYQYSGNETKPNHEIEFGSAGEIAKKTQYTWGSKGELLERKETGSDLHETVTSYKYVWDSNNNWTELTESVNGAPVSVTERKYNEELPVFPEMNMDESPEMLSINPTATASSANPKYPVSYLIDGDPQTSWVAGKQGTGAGEFITFTFDPTTALNVMHINPGYTKDDNVWTSNNRLKEISLEFSDSTKKSVTFDGNRKSYSVDLGKDKVSWMKLHIVSTYPGSKWQDTCISEVSFE